jgi:pyrrolidone-carboxylate peptidase
MLFMFGPYDGYDPATVWEVVREIKEANHVEVIPADVSDARHVIKEAITKHAPTHVAFLDTNPEGNFMYIQCLVTRGANTLRATWIPKITGCNRSWNPNAWRHRGPFFYLLMRNTVRSFGMKITFIHVPRFITPHQKQYLRAGLTQDKPIC